MLFAGSRNTKAIQPKKGGNRRMFFSHLHSKLEVEIAVRAYGVDDAPSIVRVRCLSCQGKSFDPMRVANLE